MHKILNKQNDTEHIKLLRASNVLKTTECIGRRLYKQREQYLQIMTDTLRNFNPFTSTFSFFTKHEATAEKNKKELASQRTGDSANLTRHCFGRQEARTDN